MMAALSSAVANSTKGWATTSGASQQFFLPGTSQNKQSNICQTQAHAMLLSAYAATHDQTLQRSTG